MRAVWNGVTIAESDDTIVVEGNHYFPLESVDVSALEPSDTSTYCGWKGAASYYSVVANGSTNPDAVWTYRDPKPEAQHVAGRVAFWRGVQVLP